MSVPICGEDVEVTERFTYLGSDIHVSAGCEPEVNRRLGRAWEVMDSQDHWMWHCQYVCIRTKVRVFRSFVLTLLLNGCETWTLTRDLRWRLNYFGARSLRIILGYHRLDFVSNERLLRETQMRFFFLPETSVSISCSCMDMRLIFLMLILLTRFFH